MAIENTRKYSTYSDFFPFYLSEHSKKSTRLLHYSGTIGYQVLFWSLIFTQNYLFLPLVLLAGYGPAWIGHFFYEKNKPATFTSPLWSLIGDHHMVFLLLTGRLKKELKNAGVKV